ncbi:MAG: hypothetical protein J5636_05930 [Clostridiales bacterium]|nr:hypothetical protein [Clostridiales bacterium]
MQKIYLPEVSVADTRVMQEIKMRSASKKLCVCLCILFSVNFMTGCLSLLQRGPRRNADPTDAPDWTDPVPDGMEVMYVLSCRYRVDNNGNWTESTYQYDDQGRVSTEDYKYGGTHLQTTFFYNEDGTLAREEHRIIKNGFTKNREFDKVYEYNDQGLLLTYKNYDVGKDEPNGYGPYHEYDEDGNLIRLSDYPTITTYQYENGVLVSSFTEYDYERHPTASEEFDENGNLIHYLYVSTIEADDGSEQEYRDESFYEYNDKNDQISYVNWENGEIDYRTETEYTYDNEGKVLTEKKTTHGSYLDGKKYTAVFETTYTYDKHGLLIRKETTLDGKFSEREEFDYVPMLQPVS